MNKQQKLEQAKQDFIKSYKGKLTKNNRVWYLRRGNNWEKVDIWKILYHYLRSRREGIGKRSNVTKIYSDVTYNLKYTSKVNHA
jgi:hypothetical protein